MSDVTRILNSMEAGDENAVEELLPLVYDELRRLAAAKMAGQPPGQTIQPTALVHEAWLKLLGDTPPSFRDSRHFLYAAAEAMRRILIDRARHKLCLKRGGQLERIDLDPIELAEPASEELVLELHEALKALEESSPELARIVNLRFFVGFSEHEIAEILDSSERTVQRQWAYARAWLFERIASTKRI